MDKIVLFLGAASVGKTSVIKWLIRTLQEDNYQLGVCKIDCLHTEDGEVYQELGVHHVVGLSKDICPDHFLVSNLPEICDWAIENQDDIVLIETAGLCNRCSPATKKTISVCVLDCTASLHAPQKLGPMLEQADIIITTKIDMVSQAEREIIIWKLKKINEQAIVIPVDGLVGYGVEELAYIIRNSPKVETYENDLLRHDMPSGVCSYCVGEKRVGSAFQQGVVGKIDFKGCGI